MKRSVFFAALALIVTSVITPPAGHAAFPGTNGKIAFARAGNIWVMNADGSGQTNLTNSPDPESDPAFSSDGSKIAFLRAVGGTQADIFVMNADGSGQTNLTNDPDNEQEPAWSPDGLKIAFSRSSGPRASDIWVMNADGSGQTKLTANIPGSFPTFNAPAWSPDGSKIAFSASLSDTNQEIYVMNADGTGQTALTANGVNSRFPNWSPDGSKIAFDRGPAGSADIFVMNPDGTGQTNLTNNGGQINESAAWSPDGTKIVFDSFRTGDGQIFVINADGTGETRLTFSSTRDTRPDWQPAPARAVAFASFTGRAEIERHELELKATFVLGAASDGIDPVNEAVSLLVGTFSTTIPAGSFRSDKKGRFKFEGTINGVKLEVSIRSLGGGRFELQAEAHGGNLTGTGNPVAVILTIGDDHGSATVPVKGHPGDNH